MNMKNKNADVQGAVEAQSICDRNPFMRFLSDKWKKYGYISLAAIIPSFIIILIYMIVTKGLYPFGNGTSLILDLNAQYIYYFSALRNAILGDGELLYSFARSLGGEFFGMFAYYLSSPLSFLVILFPADRMQEFCLFLMTLKTALCGLTMGYYLHKHSEKFNKPVIIAFSMLYSLCAYCIVYQTNTMWIDAVIWLPLVILGVEAIIQHGKFKLFTISLVLTLISNYYIGYMVCIFVFLYFFYYVANNPCKEKIHFIKSFTRIAVFSVLAILMAAVIIFGAYYSLSFGKNGFDDTDYSVGFRISFFDVLFKFFPGSYDTVRDTNFNVANEQIGTAGFPFIYCGLITLILLPVYFVSKKIKLREKISTAVMLTIFMLSFVISILDIAWHGFQNPQWLNNRYSFMLCFFMVALAFKAFECIEEPAVKNTVLFSAVFVGGFAIVVQKLAPQITEGIQDVNTRFEFGSFGFALFTVVMIVIYLIIIAIIRRTNNKTLISSILLAVISIELLLNGISNVAGFANDVVFTTYSKYDQLQNIVYPIVETIADNDDSFYRMEKTIYRKPNDNMQFGINGVSNSTSTLDASSIQLLGMMGYAARSHWTIYLGGNAVNDSLLGMKYIITDRDLSEFYGEPIYTAEDFAAHEGITVDELIERTMADNSSGENYYGKSAADFVVYENPHALSIAFAADDSVIDFNMKAYNTYVKEDEEAYNNGGYTNPFERLNALVTSILGEEETVQLFKPATDMGTTYSSGIKYTVSKGKLEDSIVHHKYVGDGKVTLNYTVPADKTLYLYLPAYYTRANGISASLPIADGTKTFFNNVSTNPTTRIVELGSFSAEELAGSENKLEPGATGNYQFNINITHKDKQLYLQDQEAYVYYIDTELLTEVMSRLQENQLIIESYTQHSFEGTLKTDKDSQLILTTIPYDKYWEVTVDGNRVETTEAIDTTPGEEGGGALLAFEIDSAGDHEVKITYKSKPIILGAVVSGVSLLIFIGIVIFEKRLLRLRAYRFIFYVEDNSAEPEEEIEIETDEKKLAKNRRIRIIFRKMLLKPRPYKFVFYVEDMSIKEQVDDKTPNVRQIQGKNQRGGKG